MGITDVPFSHCFLEMSDPLATSPFANSESVSQSVSQTKHNATTQTRRAK
jgi:hypothetical protein